MRAELLPGMTNVVRFPVERRARPRRTLPRADSLGRAAPRARRPRPSAVPGLANTPIAKLFRASRWRYADRPIQ